MVECLSNKFILCVVLLHRIKNRNIFAGKKTFVLPTESKEEKNGGGEKSFRPRTSITIWDESIGKREKVFRWKFPSGGRCERHIAKVHVGRKCVGVL
jgi:hypothetical protein